jgi:hypothetical protein
MAKEGFDSPHWERAGASLAIPHHDTHAHAWGVVACVLLALLCFAPIAFGATPAPGQPASDATTTPAQPAPITSSR